MLQVQSLPDVASSLAFTSVIDTPSRAAPFPSTTFPEREKDGEIIPDIPIA